MSKKSKKIKLAVTGVFAVLIAALAVWFFVFRVGKVSLPEYYQGITWDLTRTQARNLLLNDGYQSVGNGKIPAFYVENFGGYEGADAKFVLTGGDDDKLTEMIFYFKEDTMDVKKMKKFYKACTKELEKQYDKSVNMAELEGRGEDKEYSHVMYMGENTCIDIYYQEESHMMIVYASANEEYYQELLKFAK